jgi:hypothetical protein
MRWCYKTVHFDLKKEGFLGSAFLDEAEVEQSLNEYGQSGWELVSIVETQDGLIAFFKQPLEPVTKSKALHLVEEYEVQGEEIITQPHRTQELRSDEDYAEEQKPENDNDPYTIRIE